MSACGVTARKLAEEGDVDGLRGLMKEEAMKEEGEEDWLNEGNEDLNNTPLHLASSNGHVDTAKFLLQSGADPHLGNNFGATPLHLATIHGHVETVKLLLSSGATVNCANSFGFTPLLIAGDNLEILQCLISAGANIHHPNHDGYPPLHLAAMNGSLGALKYLHSSGGDIHCTNNKYGFCPLQLATRGGHLETVKYLLSSGANVDSCDAEGSTPLYWASYTGYFDIAKCLLSYGASIHSTDKNGFSALDFACNDIKPMLQREATWRRRHHFLEFLVGLGFCPMQGIRHGDEVTGPASRVLYSQDLQIEIAKFL